MSGPKFQTTCQFCVFRMDDQDGEQVGCSQERLGFFRSRGELAAKEPGENFYKINRICNTCRLPEWAEAQDTNVHDLEFLAMMEVEVKLDLIVLVSNLEESKLESTLDSLSPHEYIQSIWVVGSNLSREFIEHAKTICSDYTGKLKWYVKSLVKEEDEPGFLNDAMQACKETYVYVLNAGDEFDLNYVDELDEEVNFRMKQVLLYDYYSWEVMAPRIYHKQAFMMVGGDGKRKAVDKLRELAEEQNKKDALIAYPSFFCRDHPDNPNNKVKEASNG